MPHSQYGEKVIAFYNSAVWKKARKAIVLEKHGRCEKCGARGTEVHHIVPLTDKNVDDLSIAIGHDNLMLLCKKCHDAIRADREDKQSVSVFDEYGEVTIIDKREAVDKRRGSP